MYFVKKNLFLGSPCDIPGAEGVRFSAPYRDIYHLDPPVNILLRVGIR